MDKSLGLVRKVEMNATKKERDLLMFRQVVALSDLDVCKHLAVIEGLHTYNQFNSVRVVVPEGDDYYFNPLADNDQCVALMLKHDVQRTYEPYDFIGWSYHVVDGDNPIHITEYQDFDNTGIADLSFQKAVCLAIILNKSAAFKVS